MEELIEPFDYLLSPLTVMPNSPGHPEAFEAQCGVVLVMFLRDQELGRAGRKCLRSAADAAEMDQGGSALQHLAKGRVRHMQECRG